jgi:hypothetical protein
MKIILSVKMENKSVKVFTEEMPCVECDCEELFNITIGLLGKKLLKLGIVTSSKDLVDSREKESDQAFVFRFINGGKIEASVQIINNQGDIALCGKEPCGENI